MINDRYRRFTPREAANIQSFPVSFNMEMVSEQRQYRAIGNAVPPVLMWHVAKELTITILQNAHEFDAKIPKGILSDLDKDNILVQKQFQF